MPEDQYYFEDYLEYVLHITFAQTHWSQWNDAYWLLWESKLDIILAICPPLNETITGDKSPNEEKYKFGN